MRRPSGGSGLLHCRDIWSRSPSPTLRWRKEWGTRRRFQPSIGDATIIGVQLAGQPFAFGEGTTCPTDYWRSNRCRHCGILSIVISDHRPTLAFRARFSVAVNDLS